MEPISTNSSRCSRLELGVRASRGKTHDEMCKCTSGSMIANQTESANALRVVAWHPLLDVFNLLLFPNNRPVLD